MGVLIAKKYPTKLFLKAADHTYVECGNGSKGWACWGGKTGGTAFNSGTGSTKRANAIAAPNEKANIRCYLINGVCHQAANRILLPAGILVSGARGYWLSSGIFGTYGRPGIRLLNPCYSPFKKYANISGDLKECSVSKVSEEKENSDSTELIKKEQKYLTSVQDLYSRYSVKSNSREDDLKINIRLFEKDINFKLGHESDLGEKYRYLITTKEELEVKINNLDINTKNVADSTSNQSEFVTEFNKITTEFQDEIANTLDKTQYELLFDLNRDERIVLADPDVISSLYGEEVVKNVYGDL